MHDLGTALLYCAFLATLATGVLAYGGAALRSPGMLAASRHGLRTTWLVWLAMGACLFYGLLSHDFANKYIAAYTDQDMPLAYLIAGFWGGEKGALLFWTIALTTFSVVAVLRNRTQSQVFLGWVTGILATSILFFATLMVFESNPFEIFQAGAGPDDGKGMNPLLQNPLMAIHPPSLLTGYISFTVPFAFGFAALITGQLDSQWLRDTRKWTLVSWLFLSLGLILGGAWAYEELGWGGFWMWDPVENAGLIPWFTATAFLHSVMIQERRNMLKRWNAVLVCLTFLLTIFGTFLTRSQLIDSVHAFADSTLAGYFLWYMAVITVVSTIAIAIRWKALRADAELDSVMSREAFFVFNNVLLVGCAFVVLWGTLFGQISDAKPVQQLYNAFASAVGHLGLHLQPLTQKVQLGEPWFNQVMTPLGLAILLLTGVGPLISWRRATRKNFEKNIARPLVASALITLGVALWYLGRGTWIAMGARARLPDGGARSARRPRLARVVRRGDDLVRGVRILGDCVGIPHRYTRPPARPRPELPDRACAADPAQQAPVRRLHRAPGRRVLLFGVRRQRVSHLPAGDRAASRRQGGSGRLHADFRRWKRLLRARWRLRRAPRDDAGDDAR